VSQSYDESIIREIASLGHEVGYHNDTMYTCKGDVDKAYDEFCRNLDKFRKFHTSQNDKHARQSIVVIR
jgi:cytosine/adenosine deaminase-related metal-dependent hydrolase